MKFKILAFWLVIIWTQSVPAQTNDLPAPKKSDVQNSNKAVGEVESQIAVSRESRQQAYAKLLEGQRFLWNLNRRRLKGGNEILLAREALQKAIELDPTLAEAYTALAELTLNAPPNNIESALSLAETAVRLNPNNFGGQLILARLYTIKSNINRDALNASFTEKAVSGWKQIARLDSGSAEAFAFLSDFYRKTNKPIERVESLKKWLAASTPLDSRFYKTVMGENADLSPETASLKLGEALLDAGQNKEAIEILSRLVAGNPENTPAVELLREAVESSNENSVAVARQSLTSAVYANPENVSLITLLAQIEARAGQTDSAAKILNEFSKKSAAAGDAIPAANLQITLGDIYAESNRYDEAVSAYNSALKLRGGESIVDDAERDFAIRAFEKIIQVYKKSDRPEQAKSLIERARSILGKHDSFPDRQLIKFYRESRKLPEALTLIRALRKADADDFGMLRLEASVLTDAGRIDEAVALIKPLLDKKNRTAKPSAILPGENADVQIYSPMYDDFVNYLFVANLYMQAKRGREAVESANQAVLTAQDEERKQIGKLALSAAHQSAGNFKAAEDVLRALLRQTPGNPIALNNLGYFLAERGVNLEEALKLIEQAVKIDPANSSYLDSLGWAHFKLGNLAQAEKFLKNALRFDDGSATIMEHLGDVYQKQGKIDQAKSAWRKSLDSTFENEQANRLKSKLNIK